MWVAWSFPCLPQASPKPSAAGFSEIETITWPCLRGACMNYCMTSLLPQFPYCFFQLLGRCPHRSWAQGPNWRSGVQSLSQHWALQEEDWFWLKAVHGERKTPKPGAFFHSEGCAFLVTAVTGLCVQQWVLLVPMVFTHSSGSTCFLQLLRGGGKNDLAAFSQSIWINVLLHILCWFIPEVHPPSAALQRLLCPAQVVVVGHSPAHGAATVQPGHFFSKIFQSWTCQLCHTPSLAGHCEDGQDQWGGNAPLDLGVPTGAGRGQGEGRWEYLRLYMGNLENINCRQHWVAITSFQFLSSCRCFVSLKVLLDYHLGSPAMALLGLLWAKTHIYSFCIYSFFTYPGIQGMCSPKWNTFGSKQLLSR